MLRVLAIFSMFYVSVALGIAIHAIVVDGGGSKSPDAISQAVLERSVLWPVKIFQ